MELNLHPIGFSTTSHDHWQPWHTKVTGFENKGEYLSWAKKHRFSLFRQLVRDYRPRLIICTGTSARLEFVEAFCTEPTDVCHSQLDRATATPIWYTWTNSRKTLVAVIPFLGWRQGSLNSNELVIAVGARLRAILDQGPAAI